MKVGVVTFPGSNCDHDCYRALQDVTDAEATFLWHRSHDLEGVDAIVLPGGFSYGDYLRAGAIARTSPIMREVADFARGGGMVIGICNGFQILCEAGLLPGALVHNRTLRFISRTVPLRVEIAEPPFTAEYEEGQLVRFPLAHGEGCYLADPQTVETLERENRVVFRYVDGSGEATPGSNPNGSVNNIAGIRSEGGNVLGMMPHPERAADPLLGSEDGAPLFRSLVRSLATR